MAAGEAGAARAGLLEAHRQLPGAVDGAFADDLVVRAGVGAVADAAVLPAVLGVAHVEGVHFDRRYSAPADIGYRALAVNLSDVAAMGATPTWALISLVLPDDLLVPPRHQSSGHHRRGRRADGVVRRFLPMHRAGRIDGVVPPALAPTLFARLGNLLALGWAILFLAAAAVAMRRRRG